MNEKRDRVCASCGQPIPATAKLATTGDDPNRVLCLRCRIAAAKSENQR